MIDREDFIQRGGNFLTVLRPFVKWAGGKRQLLCEIGKRLPDSWNTYYEPFVGGGALLANLQNEKKISKAVISDLNSELINLYNVVKKDPEKLIDALSHKEFENSEEAFRNLKNEFNMLTGLPGNNVRRAALFIYLNKHGYNGLWRVNSKGKFNVPFGRYEKRSLPTEHSIFKFSHMLKNVTILNIDFEQAVKSAKKGDFIYFDPPYHPISKTANFTDYNSNGFTFDDQKRLTAVFKKLSKKGVQLMLSNSKVSEIEDLFVGFTIGTVDAKRFINCNGERRIGTREIIVTNYDV
ncbi:MAG: DNA adenine methylase [Methanoregula sp.]|nr:MAG: DNA adenine methylase [Methanoregula sp.]